jgi:hypothetical protein
VNRYGAWAMCASGRWFRAGSVPDPLAFAHRQPHGPGIQQITEDLPLDRIVLSGRGSTALRPT